MSSILRTRTHPRPGHLSGRRAGKPSRGWIALVVAVLLAFSWQTSIIQAHVHPSAVGGSGLAQIGAKARADGAPQHRPGPPLSCPLCRELAHSGHFLLPGPIAFVPPAVPMRTLARPEERRGSGPQRSHAWRSRGPPVPA